MPGSKSGRRISASIAVAPSAPMRIVSAHLQPYRLPLKRPWIAASATLTERQGALLCIATEDGIAGWGDCAPLPSSGAASHQRTFSALADLAHRLASADFRLNSCADDAALPPEVRWALETALLDNAAQRQGVTLAQLLGARTATTIAVNAALGPLDATCATRANAALTEGYAIGKIKVGIDSIDAELEGLRALVNSTGGRLQLRLDANRAWAYADAQRFLTAIADMPIDAVEEPLSAPTLATLAALQAELPYAIAIDESLPVLGATALIAAQAVRRLVLKPARLGGHTATQAIARRATAAGIEVVLTSVIDSAIGVMATAHLAAAVSPTLAHGLATSAWLAADVAAAPRIERGHLMLPSLPGLGIHP